MKPNPVDISGTVVGESPDCLLFFGTVVGENPDYVCWEMILELIFMFPGLTLNVIKI